MCQMLHYQEKQSTASNNYNSDPGRVPHDKVPGFYKRERKGALEILIKKYSVHPRTVIKSSQ